MFDAAKSAAESFAAESTRVVDNAIVPASARMQMDNLANSLVCQAQKQEMKCGASKDGEGNGAKSLPCNDECAKLERNRKLALALNIDQATHIEGGDHIPFSTDTLNLFSQNAKWGQNQEREFRVFATSEDEKRLRFKPMKAHERAFLHHLAEDFGFDSESMDPEPHRHVMVWKTPRFVSPPKKTLAEALRIRSSQRSATASANVSDTEGPAKKNRASNESGEPYNGFVVSNPRFGLTVDELRTELNSLLHPGLAITFDIEFLPNEEVVLKGVSRTLSAQDLERLLLNLRSPLVAAIANKGYGTAQLCSTDSSLNITRRETDSSSANGWATVAGKKTMPRAPVQNEGFAGANSFAALSGNKVTFAKKTFQKPNPKKAPVADDWEAAEAAEEEKERESGGEEDVARETGPAPPLEEPGAKVGTDLNEATLGSSVNETRSGAPSASEANGLLPSNDWASQVEQEID
ncbi:hypothetical protein D0862_04526 [Hortaea werneckii]|uniref:R3H domain-containing protein n=2 Tax=Hortaea werneckii TaxID=91943 RepID=A0A3M7H0B1_HORWE|nr:hypothetical protein D0862_04526 [Hortaea werneckii]